MATTSDSSNKAKVEVDECASCAITERFNGIHLKKCSRCKNASYCSKACQHAHWFKGGHKRFCVPPKERNPEMFIQEADTDFQDKCMICMDKVTEKADYEAHTLPFSHRFHTKSIISLHKFSTSKQCPVCRAPLPPPSHMYEEGLVFWAELLITFKERTGHSLDCTCHTLNESEQVFLNSCVRLLTGSAELGNLESSFFLGKVYMKGICLEQDFTQAVHWLTTNAAHENARAQYMVGVLYLNGGSGLRQDIPKAKQFLRQSAAQGDSDAQRELGTFLTRSALCVEREEGFALLEKAALQFNTAAICDLGVIYYEGTLTEKSYKKAFFYIETAATNDLQLAMYMLSGLYKRGHGVLRSEELAAEWFMIAERNADELSRTCVAAWFDQNRGGCNNYQTG